MLRELWNAVTYRNEYTNPGAGLIVVAGPHGARTVYDPQVSDYAEARRRRMVCDGLDPVDVALMDEPTAALLRATAARMAAERSRAVAARPLAPAA